jgi:predicted amidophosphoribosyltransferase
MARRVSEPFPIAVMLDLVHPVGPGRRLGRQGRDAGLAKAIGGDASVPPIVLIDDLFTTGGSLLACQDRLTEAGATVLGAITCGRTVYDATEPPFKAREFELTEELSDYGG